MSEISKSEGNTICMLCSPFMFLIMGAITIVAVAMGDVTPGGANRGIFISIEISMGILVVYMGGVFMPE